MLAHVLAIAVGVGSFALYMAAFFFPEVHRKHDFFWSGLGMFYALILWSCAGQVTGAVLLGQSASVALLGWLGWQTLVLRRVKTPLDLQTPATAESWQDFREEMTSLFRDFVSQTPLGRVLGWERLTAATAQGGDQVKIRASSLRDVGYEFLDDVEDELEPVRLAKPAAKRGAVSTPPQETPAVTPTPAATVKPRPTRQPKPEPRELLPTTKPAGAAQEAVGGVISKATALKDWLVDLTQSFSRPKPSKPVIEIPPREPSIPLPRKGREERGGRSEARGERREESLRQATSADVGASAMEDDDIWGEEDFAETASPEDVSKEMQPPEEDEVGSAEPELDAQADSLESSSTDTSEEALGEENEDITELLINTDDLGLNALMDVEEPDTPL